MPVNEGEIAAPTERAILVTPEAAERSSGDTTAIVYDWRVGTSICEMLNRQSRTVIANGSVGRSGTKISNTFDGMCVKTFVLTNSSLGDDSPWRFAEDWQLSQIVKTAGIRT